MRVMTLRRKFIDSSHYQLESIMLRLFTALLVVFLSAQTAQAHPHVFVGAKAEVIFDNNGNVIGINHLWTFDEQYSAFATMGFPKTPDGKLDPAKLAELAKINTESLSDFDYFTVAKAAGKKVAFSKPENATMVENGKAITLMLTLPLKEPISGRTFSLEVSDPTYFVAFSFDEASDAVVISKAPSGCTVSVRRPKAEDLTNYSKLSDQMFQQLTNKSEVSGAFGNQAMIACP
jgi:ABC-type uncharacterized transport system substrate-binding protein